MLIERLLPLYDEADDAAGSGSAVATADPPPASSASSATSLDDLPFPDLTPSEEGAGEDKSGGSTDGQPAGEGSPPAGELPGAAAGGEIDLPFDDDATLEAFLEEYGDAIVKHPKVQQHFDPIIQSRVDRTVAERVRAPENDERYQAITAQDQTAIGEFATEIQKATNGEPPDVQVLSKAFLTSRDATERARDIAAQRAADSAVLAVSTRLNQAAGRDLFSPELRQRYAEADQEFARLHKSPDPKTRAQALSRFQEKSLDIMVEAAIEHGRGLERAERAKSTNNRDQLQRSNLARQMRAGVAARRTPAPGGGAPSQTPQLTREALTAGDHKQTRKLLEDAGITI